MRVLAPVWLLRAKRAIGVLGLGLAMLAPAQAHLMVAQHGTLNFVGDGAFMVLSLPVSALAGVDDDLDGALSAAELRIHAAGIIAQVQGGVQLRQGKQALPLEGVMLSLSPEHDSITPVARQLIVMGRFALKNPAGPFDFELRLFGKVLSERRFEVTVTRGGETQPLLLLPEKSKQAIR